MAIMRRGSFLFFLTVVLLQQQQQVLGAAFSPAPKQLTIAKKVPTKRVVASNSELFGLRGGAAVAAGAASTATTTTPAWVSLCGKLAPTASVGLAVASLPTIQQVQKQKSVGDLPLLPYSSLLANGFVWFLYGILKKEPKVWSCNAAGVLLGVYYMWGYTRHSPSKAPTLPGSVKQHVVGALSTIAACIGLAIALPAEKAAAILGGMGVAFCIGLFASPLSALKTVFETKSAASIPLPFTLATIINCFLWSVTGLLDMHDYNIYIPNLIGLTFGLVQVVLKFIYGNGGPKTAKAAA